MLKKEWLKIRVMEKKQLLIEEAEEEIIEKIKKSETKDDNKLVLKEKKIYVLKDESSQIISNLEHYNMLIAGYRGQWKIVELITRNYWWLGVTKKIK